MLEFMVLSAPRSASTWVANWLTTGTTLCLHDPILEHRPEELDAYACDRRLGIACTGLPLLPDWVNRHAARKVIVHRDLGEVNNSLESCGLTRLSQRWDGVLDRLHGFHVYYTDLFQAESAAAIADALDIGFDRVRHAQLVAMHVEPQFERINIRDDRARAFRDRVARAFQ